MSSGVASVRRKLERWPDGVPLLVVDHYGRGAAFEHGCRPWAATILAIDDLADRRHCVDLLVTVHREVGDMASLMADADFAIGAAGGTSWERCCLGLPTLVVVTADNQRDIARSLEAAGAIDLVGDASAVTVEALADRIAALCDDAPRRHAMALAAAEICNGQGAARVVDALLEATLPTAPMARHGRSPVPRWDRQPAARPERQSQS